MLYLAVSFMTSELAYGDVLLRMVEYLRKVSTNEYQSYHKMIFKDKTEQCEGVCVWGEGDCLVWSKMFRNSIFLPSDDIRPKS